MKNKPNPDNRKDNVEHIQKNIDMTIHNIEMADEIIQKTSDDKKEKQMIDKNDRREKALDGLRHEIQDEAKHREKDKH